MFPVAFSLFKGGNMRKVLIGMLLLLAVLVAVQPVLAKAEEAAATPTVTPTVTPEPDSSGDSDNGISISDVNAFTDFIDGFKEFFSSLEDFLLILFPFFTPGEIAFLITFILIFLGVLVYLFFRKVTI